MIPYKVLETYHPRRWRASVIGPELCAITARKGFVPLVCPPMLAKNQRASWHDDKWHASVVRFAHPEYEGSGWHQDGDNTPGSNMQCQLILWASHTPTEIRHKYDSEGTVWIPEPFEVVVFDNWLCFHRRPPELSGKRWLFRQRVRR